MSKNAFTEDFGDDIDLRKGPATMVERTDDCSKDHGWDDGRRFVGSGLHGLHGARADLDDVRIILCRGWDDLLLTTLADPDSDEAGRDQ